MKLNIGMIQLSKLSTYVDDIITSVQNQESVQVLVKSTNQAKAWLFERNRELESPVGSGVKVLGVCWSPNRDTIMHKFKINSSLKRKAFIKRRTWLTSKSYTHYFDL